ncbi:MAG: ABC transporter permease [Candidatus Sumerlaeia bacterium]|nr:ABC transporter permease [Candidatus Sumerlaeia bacterium]
MSQTPPAQGFDIRHLLPHRIGERVGEATLDFFDACGDYARFAGRSLRRVGTPPWRWRMILEQMFLIGVMSLSIALVTSIFVGMVMVLQTGVQLVKFGSKGYVPGIAWIANSRAMIPAFVGIVVGARVAASIAAELGTMRVTEQIDALEVLNVDPYRYLVAPRVIAMTLMLPLITVLSLISGYLGGMLVGSSSLQIDPVEYFVITKKFAYMDDLYGGLAKTVFFGLLIAVTGCYYGFKAGGGAEGVGRATTSAVVVTLLLILISDYILSSFILALVGRLA